MKSITKLGIVLCMAGVAAHAETWAGKLIDAACFQNDTNKPLKLDKLEKECAPSAATTTFAVIADGKVFKLDSSGNSKVAADVYGGAIKADHDRDVNVTVKGSLQGDTIRVESIKGK